MTIAIDRIPQLLRIAAAFGAMLLTSDCGMAAGSAELEGKQQMKQWVKQSLLDPVPRLPFSFVYDGEASAELLPTWTKRTDTKRIDKSRTRHTITWTDPKTALQVRCVAVEYADFPVAEWTIYLKNTGDGNTPFIESIQGLDTTIQRGEGGEFVLHCNKGDWCVLEAFEPYDLTLGPGVTERFAPDGGRPTNGPKGWPYYNLQMPGGGIILAIGWPGQWASSFARDEKNSLRIVAGQELTHLYLRPGEEIRAPLIALLFWRGADVAASQNTWRRWILTCNFPKDHGKQLSPKLAGFCGNHFPGYCTDAKSEIDFIDRYVEEGFRLDYWWMDAGWYPCQGAWWNVGTWEADRTRYPDGLRAISDHAHAKKMEYILWFEPERVAGGTWLAENHPEWILGGKNGGLVDLGNPDALKWITDRIDKIIVDEGVDIYRQDYNIDPLSYWRNNDTPDRQGITEMKYVQGYLAYWDELLRRHPGMIIDSCASGGRRDDLETMRRSLPFLRSDYCTDPVGMQCHTYGFSTWLPYYRGATEKIDRYDYRSNIAPLMMVAWDMRDRNLDYALARKLTEQWRQVAATMLGDFYPLTDYSLANDVWMAFQFDRPDRGEGLVQAFRRGNSQETNAIFRLRGLDPAAYYEVTDLDTERPVRISGKDLVERGLTVDITGKPGAAVIVYKKKR